ncbi:hypothetical protein, conserved [Eimeria tenella]|uniref:Uncharacterized protein n=1 Tax=Eimeria tenella TaxID=5802 RepID=U6KU95_EIMTE|nr:hypothetical protein, conserved [Eimeria tenella]CDJ39080.1 hypothetical protein, conserved [Eimeria tenella]|eukprot:XP_013229835.1 hypothetical protein, conserved [Eimeria tenella]
MALPLQPAWREPAKRRLPSIHHGMLTEDVRAPCSSPPKIKARRLECSPEALAKTARTAEAPQARAKHIRERSPLSSPLKRRLHMPVSADEKSSPSPNACASAGDTNAASALAAEISDSSSSKMLQSPVRLHFPLTSSGVSRAAPELPPFPSAVPQCVAPGASAGGSSDTAASPQRHFAAEVGGPQGVSTGGGYGAPLNLDARSFLATAAAAAAAAAAGPGSPQGAATADARQQQRPSFLDDPASPFSTGRRRRPPPVAEVAAASEAVAKAAATPSPTRRPAAGARGIPPTAAHEDSMDHKVSPVSSRRRASPYHCNSSRAETTYLENEAVSPFLLTPPRKKPQFSFDGEHGAQCLQRKHSGEQESAGDCEMRLTPQEVASMQQLFSEQQRLSGRFHCSALDTCAAAEAPLAAVKLNRQLERLCRLYGLLRILFDRFYDRGEPLLLFSGILPAYTKLALTHYSRSATEPDIGSVKSNSSSSVVGYTSSVSTGSGKVRNDLIKDVGRLVWLLPQLLQWKPRKPSGSAIAPSAAPLSPLRRQQQMHYDIQIVELKDGIPLSSRARDGEERQQKLRQRLVAYTLQWQNCCLQLQQQHEMRQQVSLLRRSRELLIQHASWVPGFDVDSVPSPPAAAPPEPQQEQQHLLQPQQAPGAFKGESLIGHIGGSPIRCVRQQQQERRATGTQHVQMQEQKKQQNKQVEETESGKSATPVATTSVGGFSSVSTCSTRQSSSPPDLTRECSSPSLLSSPLTRGRQPTRRPSLFMPSVGNRSPSPSLVRRSVSNSTSPTRSPVSERLRRKTEERMTARLQQEAAQQIRRELYENVQRLKEVQIVLQCLLDACLYQDRRSRIDVRVLTDLFVSRVRTPLPLSAVERAVVFLEGIFPATHLSVKKVVDSKLREAQEAALAADAKKGLAPLE